MENLRLQVPRKKNLKRSREPWLKIYKSLMRKYIETMIGEIAKMFPKKIHATNLKGFLLKIALFFYWLIKLTRFLFNKWQLGLIRFIFVILSDAIFEFAEIAFF